MTVGQMTSCVASLPGAYKSTLWDGSSGIEPKIARGTQFQHGRESCPIRAPTQIANNIGIATISNPPVNSLSSDVCDKLLESFDEFEKARVRVVIIGANPSIEDLVCWSRHPRDTTRWRGRCDLDDGI